MKQDSPLQRLRQLEAAELAARQAAAPQSSRKTGKVAAAVGGVSAAVAKWKVILLFLAAKLKFLLAAVKFGPMLLTFSSMGVSAFFYANYFGWPLAVGLVILILVHELGHGAAAVAMGLKVGAPIFIPFFGASIALKEQPRSTWVEAVTAFCGPLAGTLGGLAVLAWAMARGPEEYAGKFCLALAHITLYINLFNLIPVFGLDGDRITQPFRPGYWIPGGVFLLFLTVSHREGGTLNPILLFLLITGGIKGARTWQAARGEPERLVDKLAAAQKYPQENTVTPAQRRIAAWAYFALVAVLASLTLDMPSDRATAPGRTFPAPYLKPHELGGGRP